MVTVTADATERFPHLFQVFGGYLHQDFDLEYASPDEALSAAGQEYHDVPAAVSEIDRMLESGLDDRHLTDAVERLTAGYSPELDGWQIRPWLDHAREILEAA
jgi:hypothetical protein